MTRLSAGVCGAVDSKALKRYDGASHGGDPVVARKISVYVDEELHRTIKAAASLQGLSLSEFVLRATLLALKSPNRRAAAARMDSIRTQIAGKFSANELRAMREEGRRN